MNFFEKIGLVESVPTQPEEEPNLNFSFDVAPSAEPATVSPDAAQTILFHRFTRLTT